MKRVLVITYYWPPSGGSGVQRWLKFAKYLPSEGWQPVVYAPENAAYPSFDPGFEAEVPAECEVIRRPITEPYGVYRRLMGKKASTEVTEISSGRKTFKQKLSLWIRANLFVPDPRVGWVRPSVRYLCKYLKEHPVDAVITTGPPQSMHLIGLEIHKRMGIPWIPDFRDPWTKMYYLKHLPMTGCTWKRLCRQEQAVLDGASRVLAVTPLVQEDFRKKTSTPVAMITNGFDASDFDGPAPASDGFFNLTHTGLFAKDGNPAVLWKVLGEMVSGGGPVKEKLRIRLVGKVDREVMESIVAAGLGDNVVSLGYLGHSVAVAEQRSAGILLLPLRHDPDYRPILPGKLFEYLASRRPILGIGQSDGAMARVIADAKAGITADWDDEPAIRNFIEQAYRQYLDGGIPPCTGEIDRYSRTAITHQLAQLLDSVL